MFNNEGLQKLTWANAHGRIFSLFIRNQPVQRFIRQFTEQLHRQSCAERRYQRAFSCADYLKIKEAQRQYDS